MRRTLLALNLSLSIGIALVLAHALQMAAGSAPVCGSDSECEAQWGVDAAEQARHDANRLRVCASYPEYAGAAWCAK